MFGGFLAYGSGSEDARRANSDEARRILKEIREKSSKRGHREVSIWGIHQACRSVAEEWDWAGKPHCFTRVKSQGPYWLEVGYALGGRRYPCVVGGF